MSSLSISFINRTNAIWHMFELHKSHDAALRRGQGVLGRCDYEGVLPEHVRSRRLRNGGATVVVTEALEGGEPSTSI